MDKYKWVKHARIKSVEIRELCGNLSEYTDSDSTGSSMIAIDKYSGIIDSAKCISLRFDEKYLKQAAVEVPSYCHFYYRPVDAKLSATKIGFTVECRLERRV